MEHQEHNELNEDNAQDNQSESRDDRDFGSNEASVDGDEPDRKNRDEGSHQHRSRLTKEFADRELEPGVETRILAAKILTKIIRDDSWATPVIDKALNESTFDKRDRSFVANLVFSTLRYLGTVDYVVYNSVKRDFSLIDPVILSILRISSWELAMGKAPQHAIVYAAVEAGVALRGENLRAFVNGALRGVIRQLEENDWPSLDTAYGLGLNLGYPEWIIHEAYDRFGDDRFESTLQGGNDVPNLHLRAVKKREDIVEQMERQGQDATASEMTEHGIVLNQRIPVRELKVVRSGQAIVQDLASQLVINAGLDGFTTAVDPQDAKVATEDDDADVQPEDARQDHASVEGDQADVQPDNVEGDQADVQLDNVEGDQADIQPENAEQEPARLPRFDGVRALDVCAAPGGKSTYLAQLGFNVTAQDVSAGRLERVAKLARRLGLEDQIEVVQKNGLDDLDENEQPYPLVLVDAPCSGLGVMRRRPEIRWRKKSYDIENLHDLQYQLLTAAKDKVADGGRIVYSVCTWTEAETEHVVRRFLKQNPDVSLYDLSEFKYGTHMGYGLQFMPDQEQTDGMYVAVFTKHKNGLAEE